MSTGLLGLCAIARDEEAVLGRCLKSASAVVDDLVVVDTGSTDRTVEVAQCHGARVYFHPWSDDFGAARNASLAQAEATWILVLDADEELSAADPAAFRRWLSEATGDCYRVDLVNVVEGAEQGGERAAITRLFRRDANFVYAGAIHEQLVRPGGEPPPSAGIAPGLRILHHGYGPGTVSAKGKFARNRRLLERALAVRPNDPYLQYQLGLTLYQLQEYPAADCQLRAALAGAPGNPLVVREAAYCLKAMGRADEAMVLVDETLSCHPAYTDLVFLKGLLLLDLGQVTTAARAFLRCLEQGEAPPDYQSRLGVGSFLPAYNLGVIFELVGDLVHARENYELALAFNPAFQAAAARLAGLA